MSKRISNTLLTVANCGFEVAFTVYGGGGVPGGPIGDPGGVSYRGLTLPIWPKMGSFVSGSVNIAAVISFKLDGLERVLECWGGGKCSWDGITVLSFPELSTFPLSWK